MLLQPRWNSVAAEMRWRRGALRKMRGGYGTKWCHMSGHRRRRPNNRVHRRTASPRRINHRSTTVLSSIPTLKSVCYCRRRIFHRQKAGPVGVSWGHSNGVRNIKQTPGPAAGSRFMNQTTRKNYTPPPVRFRPTRHSLSHCSLPLHMADVQDCICTTYSWQCMAVLGFRIAVEICSPLTRCHSLVTSSGIAN
jgi:hypothetical protein